MIKRSLPVSTILFGGSDRNGDGSTGVGEPEADVAAPAMALTIVTAAARRKH